MRDRWQKVRIGDLGRVITGRTPPSKNPEYFGEKFSFITPGDMHVDKRVWATSRHVSEAGAKYLRRILIPSNSVCVSCIGWQMGNAVMTTSDSFTNQQINTIIPNNKVLSDFLFYSLKPRKQELLALGSAIGVRTPILKKTAFEDLLVNLPPFREQEAIVELPSAYDDLIENNLRRIKILEEMAQNLYREWFVKFRFPGHEKVRMVDSPLGLIPEGWVLKKLGDIITLQYGKALKKSVRLAGNIPVYGSSGVVGYHNKALCGGPGVIVGRKGNVGSVYWSNYAFYPIDTVFYVETDLPLSFVYCNLQDQNFINNDAAVPGLNRNQAYSLPLILPPNELMENFSNIISLLFGSITNLRMRIDVLRQTRDLLLPKLISGELDVSDLNIETDEAAVAN